MDVGCGTGILSIFCAQAGAKRVICLDMICTLDNLHAYNSSITEHLFENLFSAYHVALVSTNF